MSNLPEPSSPQSPTHSRWSNQNVVYHHVEFVSDSSGRPQSGYSPEEDHEHRDGQREEPHETKYVITEHPSEQHASMAYHQSSPPSYVMAESSNASDNYRQMAIHSYNGVDSEAVASGYCQSPDNSMRHYSLRQDSHASSNSPVSLITQGAVSRTHSPASSSPPDSVAPHSSVLISSLQNDVMDSQEMDDVGMGSSSSLDNHLILHPSSSHLGGIPIVLDRNSLATYIASVSRSDPTLAGLDASLLHSHRQSIPMPSHLNLSQRNSNLLSGGDQSQFLSNDTKAALNLAHSLLSPILSQRDLLSPLVTSAPSTSSVVTNNMHNIQQQQQQSQTQQGQSHHSHHQPQSSLVSSFPIHHKHMLAQKYAAELEEGPSPGTSSDNDQSLRESHLRNIGHRHQSLRDPILQVVQDDNDLRQQQEQQQQQHEVEMDSHRATPFSVASSSNNLMGAVSMYMEHHEMVGVSSGIPTSCTQTLPMDVYGLERGVALVSSTRDGPDDLMDPCFSQQDVQRYNSPIHNHNHHHHHQNPGTPVHSYVSSTEDLLPQSMSRNRIHLEPKLHGQEEGVDSSDNYRHHVDNSEELLHSTTQGFINSIEDLESPEDGASSTVLSSHSQMDSSHGMVAGSSGHLMSNAQMEHSETLEDIQCCGVVSSASHPDSESMPEEIEIIDEMKMELVAMPGSSQQNEDSRPRRDLRTGRTWCEDCGQFYEKECPRHRIQLIFDKPVLSRAWASLPATYLYVNKIAIREEDGEPIYGVFAKKTIPKRTQFGPIEGALVRRMEKGKDEFFLVIDQDGESFVCLDTSDESTSNWMRFVRPAETFKEQNLILVQQGQQLFFNTTKPINPKTELRVWYSQAYSEKWNLTVLEPDGEERKALEERDNSWPCFECNKRFSTSVDLQKHLNQHDEEEESEDGKAKLKARAKSLKLAKETKVKPTPKSAIEVLNDATQAALARKSKPKPINLEEEESSTEINDYTENSNSNSSNSKITRNKILKPNKSDLSPPKEVFTCEICAKTFPRNYSLQRHLILHSGEKKYKCPICNMEFSHVYNRNRHVRRHRQRGENDNVQKTKLKKKKPIVSWNCTQCKLRFNGAIIMHLHALSHKTEDIGGLLGEEDSKTQSSVNEENMASPEPPASCTNVYKCPECANEYTNKRQLVEHAGSHGIPRTKALTTFRGVRATSSCPLKPYKCNLCYKSFATDERLIRHYMVHGSEDTKPLQCNICSKRFLNNSALACHIKVHSDEKKFYECPICKDGFHQIITLKEHVHSHCKDGIYTCPHCQKPFEEYNQIRKHIRAFHSDRRYPCPLCEKQFPRPDKLKLHMLRHSDHREFLCSDCGKQFKRKDKLKEHMKRMHGPQKEPKVVTRPHKPVSSKKFIPKVSPTDYHRFIYKCHSCLLGFKRRGMLVNHLAKRHPDIRPDSVPELNLPILKTTRDYYCQYCEKIYKSSSKRKSHILRNHPGAELPMSNRRKGGVPEVPGIPNPTFSQTVGSVTTHPHHCNWCHKQYASKAKLLQHQRKKHMDLLMQNKNFAKNNEEKERQQQQKPVEDQQEEAQNDDDELKLGSSSQIMSSSLQNSQQQEVLAQLPVQNLSNRITGPFLITQTLPSGGLASEGTVIINGIKRKIHFIERDSLNPTMIASTQDNLPSADLLTQAMSALTHSVTEFANGEIVTRISTQSEAVVGLIRASALPVNDMVGHPESNIPVASSSSCNSSTSVSHQVMQPLTTNGRPQQVVATVIDQSDPESTTLDPHQLNQLLAQYHQQPLSPQSLATAVTTKTLIMSNESNYSDR